MAQQNSIEEIFFKYLLQYQFDENDLDYTLVEKHSSVLQMLSEVSNSGSSIFDLCKRQIVFYSANYGKLLGYAPADYEKAGQQFFADKIHEDDKLQSSLNGVTVLKLFNSFSSDEKLNHKLVNEYRMLNAENKYVRLIEQHQVLELDKKGQIWLLVSFVDISPDQEINDGLKSQLLNFRTGKVIPIERSQKPQFELTKRELEILKLVKEGYLSKEISDKLAISVHTVNTHRQRFLEKLGANNSFEAIMFASKFGLLD
ncbi:MAG TPA: LuxR C-terminal-related transcriptional regulator [Niabella sp.]|nr:LuxR C-terminal-related transcriptional regulator [Niabella sp.]